MVIGVDPHKSTHTGVAVDELGRGKGQKTVPARREGHRDLIARARQACPGERAWAVEDVRHVAGGLVRDLLAAGEQVVFVPPKLMAGARRGGRERGKSDPIDALAIGRAALREDAFLPPARLSERVLPVRQLSGHRDDLVAGRTRVICRLRWLLHDLAPGLAPGPRALTSARQATALRAAVAALPQAAATRIALSQLARLTALTTEISTLEKELTALITSLAPTLLAIPGAGPVTAARIPGETGDIRRFRSKAAFARHNGTAPIPASSGNSTARRLSRSGNRQLNAAIHRIAITQARCHPDARKLPDRRAASHRETPKSSLRVLKRHISDVVYRTLTHDAPHLDQPQANAA